MNWTDNLKDIRRALVEAIIIGIVISGVAIGLNAARPDNGIPLVATVPYETVVPCPDLVGEIDGISPDAVFDDNAFVVDARDEAEFNRWHVDGAVLLTFDYLFPISEESLQTLIQDIASARPQRVIVYGDGGEPDSGEQLAKDISHHGIKNVFFVQGGGPAIKDLQKRGGAL